MSQRGFLPAGGEKRNVLQFHGEGVSKHLWVGTVEKNSDQGNKPDEINQDQKLGSVGRKK